MLYILQVNHRKIERDLTKALGLQDKQEMKQTLDKVQEVLAFNLATTGGFTTGFVMGLRLA
jgi:hypothetical protein